jgi:hypothetical protein
MWYRDWLRDGITYCMFALGTVCNANQWGFEIFVFEQDAKDKRENGNWETSLQKTKSRQRCMIGNKTEYRE